MKWGYILTYLDLYGWDLVPTKTLKLSDFKVLGQSGQRISEHTEQQIAVSGPETRGTDGSLAVRRGHHRP